MYLLNSYYDKPDSIILSVHYSDETRIESVEYSLTYHKVIQCHSKHNQDTELHERIINLVNANANRFIEAKRKKTYNEIHSQEPALVAEPI